jgi:hypothetical protein
MQQEQCQVQHLAAHTAEAHEYAVAVVQPHEPTSAVHILYKQQQQQQQQPVWYQHDK